MFSCDLHLFIDEIYGYEEIFQWFRSELNFMTSRTKVCKVLFMAKPSKHTFVIITTSGKICSNIFKYDQI